MILDIIFSQEGLNLYWKSRDIVKYIFEIKHYIKSPKSIPRLQSHDEIVVIQEV